MFVQATYSQIPIQYKHSQPTLTLALTDSLALDEDALTDEDPLALTHPPAPLYQIVE